MDDGLGGGRKSFCFFLNYKQKQFHGKKEKQSFFFLIKKDEGYSQFYTI